MTFWLPGFVSLSHSPSPSPSSMGTITPSMFHKGWLIRDARPIFEKFKGWAYSTEQNKGRATLSDISPEQITISNSVGSKSIFLTVVSNTGWQI